MTQRSKLPATGTTAETSSAKSVGEQIKSVLRDISLDWLVIAILIAAYVLRMWHLEIKPPHFDEGINGHFVAKMWRDGFYKYDPTNFHGPLYFYFLQLSELIFGRGIFASRFITSIISVGCVMLMAAHRRFLGAAAVWASLALAISVGAVFYGRYAIHESLFIFCQLLFSYGFFLYREKQTRFAVGLMSAGFFGTVTLKETFFIFFGTWLIALFCLYIERKYIKLKAQDLEPETFIEENPEDDAEEKESEVATPTDWLLIFSLGALGAVIFFTGAFLHQQGFWDMFAALKVWTKTGTGNSGHEKPFIYWFDLLVRYEWPALAALVLTPILFFFVGSRRRLLCLVAFGTWLAYSIIPYKTPWLILNLLWPLLFVFGFAMEKLTHLMRYRRGPFFLFYMRWPVYPILTVAILVGVDRTLRLNFIDFTNEREPYVYVQSTMQMKRVMDYISERVKTAPEDLNMKVVITVRDPWPLPWIFSLYPNLSFGKPDAGDFANAHVVFADGSGREQLESRLHGRYYRLPFALRDSYERGFVYLAFDKFNAVVPSDSEVFEKSGEATP